MNSSRREEREKALQHGVYRRMINAETGSFSKKELKGVVYVWGTNT